MTNEEVIEAWKRMYSEIDKDNWLFVGTINPEMVARAIKALETGEIYITGEDYNLYMEGYKAGKKDFEPEQGEWIIIDDCEQFIAKCSVCGRIEDSRMVKDYPFCHCGAKMGGKEE